MSGDEGAGKATHGSDEWLDEQENLLKERLEKANLEQTRLLRLVKFYEDREELRKVEEKNSKLANRILVFSESDSEGDHDRDINKKSADDRTKKKRVRNKKTAGKKSSKSQDTGLNGLNDDSDSCETDSQVTESARDPGNCEYDSNCCSLTNALTSIINAMTNGGGSVSKPKGDGHSRYFGHAETGDGWRTSKSRQCKKVEWAHENLGPRYNIIGDDEMSFYDLDLRLLCAGEINICASKNISDVERNARFELLSDILFNSGYYQWNAILRFYAAVLTRIQDGELKWGDSYQRMEQMLLMPFPLSRASDQKGNGSGRRTRDPDRPIYCQEFQADRCLHGGDHQGKFYGETVTLRHCCMTCLKEDGKVLDHPASSENCPHNG